jgi:hypothetical protein
VAFTRQGFPTLFQNGLICGKIEPKNNGLMKLFLCHASENKDFVRPLAETLGKRHEVWYDEYSIKLGDSLSKKIDEGLAQCDFGVVVLSPDFFKKDWPRKELDALVSMETQSRKIILPIWKDITHDEVAKYSPLLASRYAVSASKGLPTVVAAIEAAVDSNERTREIDDLSGATEALRQVGLDLKAKKASAHLLSSAEGPGKVLEAFNELVTRLENLLRKIQNESPELTFAFEWRGQWNWVVRAIKQLTAQILVEKMYANAAHHSIMIFRIYRQHPRGSMFGQEPEILSDSIFRPFAKSPQTIVWRPEEGEEIYRRDEFAALVIRRLTEAIEEGDETIYQ